jgi:peptide/nickel transport system permease protein
MVLYIARRLFLLIPMLIGVALISFLLSHVIPADPITANLGDLAISDPDIVAAYRHRWGLDRSPPEQFLVYLANLVHGDMGTSISTGQPVTLDLVQHLPATIELALLATAFGIAFGIPLGVASALRRGRGVDQVVRVVSLIGVSAPLFWLGLVAILVFYARLGWAPAPGRLSAVLPMPPMVTGFIVPDALLAGRPDEALDALSHLLLPALVLSLYSTGLIARMMRASMLEALREDYVRTAQGKGLRPRDVTWRHAFPNALIPVITIIGLTFGGLLSGTVVMENVFAWPGLGAYAFRSAVSLDYPAIMGVGMLVAMTYILVNLVVDVLYAMVDPRIRLR